VIAGLAGTAALNAMTYVDIALRGRPASRTPQESARRLADRLHVDVGTGERAEHRLEGLGTLLGYATGVGTAVGYAALGGYRLPRPVSALALGALAMVAANAPMAVLGVSDSRTCSRADWLSDAVPHLAYGVAAAAAG
jgi:hypothetical protein